MGCILFSLFLGRCKSGTGRNAVKDNLDVERPVWILTANLVVWQGEVGRLALAHQLVFVVVIGQRHLNLVKCRKDKLFGVNHSKVEINRTDERLENILEDVRVGVPAVPDPLVVHENPRLQTKFF